MRQAGIIAAGGVYALDYNVERLAKDHANAKLLAEGLSSMPGVDIRAEEVETNIIFLNSPRKHRSPPLSSRNGWNNVAFG